MLSQVEIFKKLFFFFNRHSYFFTVIPWNYCLRWTCSKILKSSLWLPGFFCLFSLFPFSVLHFPPLSVYLTHFSTELYQKFCSQNAFISVLCPQTCCFLFCFSSSTLRLNISIVFPFLIVPVPPWTLSYLLPYSVHYLQKHVPAEWSFGDISNENMEWSICRTCLAWLQAQQVKQIAKLSREMVKKSKAFTGRSGKSYFSSKLEYWCMLKNLE